MLQATETGQSTERMTTTIQLPTQPKITARLTRGGRLEKAYRKLFVLTNKGRVDVLNYLIDNPDSSVSDIALRLKLGHSDCSQILGDLRRMDLVDLVVEGKFHYYSANEEDVKNVKRIIEALIENQ